MENGDVGKLNAKRIENLEKALNDRQQHLYELLMDTKKSGNGNSNWKQLLAAMSFMLIIIGAITTSMQQQFGYLNQQVKEHAILDGHATALERHASAREKFKEVETQFDGLREAIALQNVRNEARMNKMEEWQRWWYRNIPHTDAQQDGKIASIEKELERINELFKIRNNNITKLTQ